MWKEPDPDPGGDPPSSALTSRELSELKDQNEQQQLMIAQLKEMLRKEQSTVPQEKIEEYINTISKAKAKKTKLKKDQSGSSEKQPGSGGTSVDSNKNERVNLMKQLLEENKAKLAQKGLREKGLEEMLTTLKAQLNDSQQSINASPVPTIFSVSDKNLEFNKNTSQEELYNILLVKEKKFMDFMEKNRKQEATILDLQENLKEKDSVIDARTKAITLMSDNLSKKSKDSLDALEETREQMRKMQEDFVQLESEMKARQMKLLDDLKAKNLEIATLQEYNERLIRDKNENLNISEKCDETIIHSLQQKLDQSTKENEQYLEKISSLEKRLEESSEDVNRLKNVGLSTESTGNNDGEIVKLRKQLEESNKNMIKLKAQSKSKIKELTKKIDSFKKISDANALIVQLQNEITKLNEKIAELEEEKGNMQLKMVESSDSIKDSTHIDESKDIQEKLASNLKELDEKDKVISVLESDIITLKEEINTLNEKILNFSHLENAKVTSEIKSIQIEEQLEKLENENARLQKIIEELTSEKNDLMEKIEELNKEKQELNVKLDNYIQENIELIDKLEKLSAEKVSSAESIEIVEGLTQQEKLDFAAYQKTVDNNSDDSTKGHQDDNNCNPPAELNESVLQLNEDSAELLNKIEMFNMERKEVMAKLDALREENSQLSLKLSEVENNRDILAETYELLQTDKEELQKENEQLLEKLEQLDSQGSDVKIAEKDSTEDYSTTNKLKELQSHYEKILNENDNMKRKLKEFDVLIHEKDNLETKLAESKSKINELESIIKINLEEITNYQTIIEENKDELINSAKIINELQNNLCDREGDIRDLNVLINDLNKVVSDLQKENEKLINFELMDKQVNELKTALDEHTEVAEARENELKDELAYTKSIFNELQNRNKELNDKLSEKEETIKSLEMQMAEEKKTIGNLLDEMQQKYIRLQTQLDGNNDSFEKKVEELSIKNKEQMEKMKKIAANLKKKSQAYIALEQKYNEEKEKWETEVNRKETGVDDDKIASLQAQVKELTAHVSEKARQLEESEMRVREATSMINNLEQQKVELQNSLLEMKHRLDKINEVSLKQELSTSLHEEFDNLHGNNESTNADKIKELELIIETNETDLGYHKERLQRLEEEMFNLMEDKNVLQQKTSSLEQELTLASRTVEEKLLVEEELGRKLAELAENIAVLTRKLEESAEQGKEQSEKNREHEELINKLKIKLKKAHDKVTQLKAAQSNIEELENENIALKKHLAHLEASQKHVSEENEELQKRNQSDYEKIEADYQIQLEELVRVRNELTVECEKLQEDLKNVREREEEILSEMGDYKQKVEDLENQQAIKIQQLTEELETTTNNWHICLEQIDGLKQELTTTQKQLVIQAAKEAIENVVTEATERVFTINSKETQTVTDELESLEVKGESEVVQKFHWPEAAHNQNWFGNIEDTEKTSKLEKNQLQQEGVEVTKEDLVSKIKALEMLLYNVDKEKEEILDQCSGMLNELTRLVYEKVNSSSTVIDQPLADFKHGAPSEVESQILSTEDIVDAANDQKTLRDLEFERCSPSLGQQEMPVVEEVLQPKKAYLTYQTGVEAFGENDDGWGWGPEEAKLEEEHLHRAESTLQVQALRTEIAELQEKLQVYQVERENHLEEIKQLQVKSGKLIKKCKELKQKNDQLVSQKPDKNADVFDLDQTIQEELKAQIALLEKKIKDLGVELDKERLEKTNILKRVDVLTAANDKMTEMKEIQDSEVLRWKRKYEEAEEKLQQEAWNSDGFNESSEPKQPTRVEPNSDSNTEELQQLIKDLTLDNEELQTLLNEQRQLRIDAEKKNKKSYGTEEELAKMAQELQTVQQELSNQTKSFGESLEERNKVITELQGQLNTKQEIIDSLEEKLRSLSDTNNELKASLEATTRLANQAEDPQQIAEYRHQLQERNAQLDALLLEKTTAIEQLKSSRDEAITLNDSLGKQVEHFTSELESLKGRYDDLAATSSSQILKLQNELEEQKQNSLQQDPNEVHPIVQQLTNCAANTLLEVCEKFHKAVADYDNLRTSYDEIVGFSESTAKQLKELQGELLESKRELCKLQSCSSTSIADLQMDLEEHKQKLDQYQSEKSALEKQLSDERQKNRELQFEVDLIRSSEPMQQQSDDLVQRVKDLEGLVADKEESIRDLEKIVEDTHQKKAVLDEEMKDLKNSLNEKQVELDYIVAEMETKFSKTVAEMEEKWVAQVDERGNTVAESWKYHLNMVESEFAAIQEKLKNEITELEEKCNVLVNENNELRKNVDTDIKNEVDRTSALQQQIIDSQQAIKELKEMLSSEQVEKTTLNEQVTNLEYEKENLQQLLAAKELELSSLRVIIETTQKQFDEKRQVIEEIVKLLETNTSWPLSCEKEDVLNELQRQLNVIHAKDEEINRLNVQLSQLQDKENEMVKLNDLVDSLQNQLRQAEEKDQEMLRQSQVVEELQQRVSALQVKDDEILKLQGIIEEYKVQFGRYQEELHTLQQDKVQVSSTVDSYRLKLEELTTTYNALQTSLEDKNQQIESLKQQWQQAENKKDDNNREMEKIEREMSQVKQDNYALQQSLAECQQQLFQVNQDLASKAYELENVHQQLAYSQRNCEILETEFNNLRQLLDAKQQEHMTELEEIKKGRLNDLENHYEEILSSKDIDLQTARAQLNESIANNHELAEKLKGEQSAKEEIQKSLEEKIREQSALLEEEHNQLSELREIIEQQVVKIEKLKEELFQKSNDYDSLIAQMDISRKAITQQPTSSNENPGTSASQRQISDEEPASRAELDLALYMLHQRDVRCEELTVELTQLLEERDTLQLRLSNALREKEEIRRNLTGTENVPSNLEPSTPHSKSSAMFLTASGSELARDPLEMPKNMQDLDSKLSELKMVGYKKDKTFVDEQQLRRLQQMSIMQQHIGEASKLPPEAQAKLVDASYTLSRDVQSPSKVLLNWLWGNSTPKFNES